MVEITLLAPEDLAPAAQLFADRYQALRRRLPELPGALENPAETASRLGGLQGAGRLLAARQEGRLAGYLGWYVVQNFRDSGQTAAYCPEWAHASVEGNPAAAYRALYRAAAELWAQAGCRVHALTLLANDPLVDEFWFWNGFGLLVVDAVRSMQPLQASLPEGFSVRPATPDDAQALSELDVEHRRHYAASPVFMPPRLPGDAAAFTAFLAQHGNSAWLALQGEQPAGFIQFEPGGNVCDMLAVEDSIGITGAYVRPAYRGQRLAVAILAAALQDYASRGFARCVVDFESFNPEASAFWLRHFEPACYSVRRVPESPG